MGNVATKYSNIDSTPVGVARQTWLDPRPDTLKKQIELFEELGFCILRSVASPVEVAALRSEYERLARDWESIAQEYSYVLRTSHDGFDREPDQEPNSERPIFRKIGRPCLISSSYQSLMLSSRLLDFMREIMGPDICLFRDVLYPKAARIARQKPWHHDQAYWPWGPRGGQIVQTMTAIDPHAAENACLQVIPRSHREHWIHEDEGERRVLLDDNTIANAVSVVLDPGDTLVFSSLLLHASPKNTSPNDRCVVYVAYCPTDIRHTGRGEPTSCIPIPISTCRSEFNCEPR
jgi:ectoine hydroxylase-related dioxygenase (phytanoyl-CoA dioxygenase family)